MPAPKRLPCGFCADGNHPFCPGTIKNATKATPDRTWTCPCAAAGHGKDVPS